MKKNSLLKRLFVVAFALILTLSGFIPWLEPLEAQAQEIVSSQVSTDEISSLMDNDCVLLEPGASILFSANGYLTIDGETNTYESGSIWTNDSSNKYYVDTLSYNDDCHGVELVSCTFSGNYYIDVWYDEAFDYGTRETHCYRFELGSSTTMNKDSIIDTLYGYFPSYVVIKDNTLYTSKSCSSSYGDTVDATNGDISLDGGTYDVILNAFVLVGRENTDSSPSPSSPSPSTSKDTPKETKVEENEPVEVPKTPETHYGTFQEDAITKVQTAIATMNSNVSNGDTPVNEVKLDTGVWVSFNKAVYEEIQKCTVPVSITFIHQRVRYTVTIPADADVLSLVDENGYCGFLNLGAHYGYTSIENL